MVLVSHDGERWLPTVLEGLAGQLTPVAHRVGVDTGSKDGSAALLTEAFGAGSVGRAARLDDVPGGPAGRAGQAGRAGRRHRVGLGPPRRRSPHPEALLALLAGAADEPDADVLGPMLREWPSLKRLLELGVTISGTGRRETGLERGEYDQGQYSEVRRVLAVNTAGMLVRRRVLDELGGLDDELPIFGNDLDFGWRAAAAGHHTVVVPQAVVFHVEAAHRGLRRTPLTGRHTHYQERRPRCSRCWPTPGRGCGRCWPCGCFSVTVARMLGLLAIRAPGQALDDLAAYVSVVSPRATCSPPGASAARRRPRTRRRSRPAGAPVAALPARARRGQ